MRDQERLTRPVAGSLPAEMEIANPEHVGEQLRAAFAPGATGVITGMGLTVFCCTFDSRQLVAAHIKAMIRLTNPGPEIGDCRRSNHMGQYSAGDCRASRRPVLAVGR